METVVLSYGMGVDSTAILLRWLTDPTSRDFDLSQLVVVTAQTGDEWADAPAQATAHVLPLLAAAGVRFVELAKAGPTVAHGFAVLQDTTAPTQLHPAGVWKLSDEMKAGALVPQRGGPRRCSIKFKGDVIDRWLAYNLPAGYRHALGFAKGEEGRADRDSVDGAKNALVGRLRRPFYPLLDWGWDRAACLGFIASRTGVAAWAKSCCTFCPFSSDQHLGRGDDAQLAATLRMERNALAFNDTQQLFGKASALHVYSRSAPAAVALHEAQLAEATWGVYEVKRAWGGSVRRSIVQLATGTHDDMLALLGTHGAVWRDAAHLGGTRRVVLIPRPEKGTQGREHQLVLALADTPTKTSPGFAAAWAKLAPSPARTPGWWKRTA